MKQSVGMMITGKSLGGSKQVFIDYACMLKSLGYSLTLVVKPRSAIALRICDQFPTLIDYLDFITYWRSGLSIFKRRAVRQLRELFDIHKMDTVICHKPIDCMFSKLASPSITVIAIAHGFYSTKSIDYLKYADKVICVSQSVDAFISDRLSGVPTQVIYNSVLLPAVQRQQLNTVPVIGILCVFRRKKNIPLLLKACQQLVQRGVDFKLYIAGNGPQKLTILYHIWALKLGSHVELLGWVEGKEALLNSLDICAVSSNAETFNMTIIEAMSYQVPVVSTRCGGPEEIVVHEDTGILVNKGDVAGFANALQRLIEDWRLRESMGLKGRARVKELFSREQAMRDLDTLIQSR